MRPQTSIDQLAWALSKPAVARQEASPVRAGEEAEVLGVRLACDREPRFGGDPPDLRLGQLAEWEAQPRERLGRQRGEHVGLVLGGIGGRAQQRPRGIPAVGEPRVVTCRKLRAPEHVGERQHRVEADMAIAAHARVRRLAGSVRGDERLNHAGAELVA